MPLEISTRAEVNTQGQGYIRAEIPELSAVAPIATRAKAKKVSAGVFIAEASSPRKM